ncbi:integrase [Gordonia phage Neville]|uniref:Integrase n=2 Tax=Nevillevirus TaxID=3044773 RepID=A0A515MGU4_9CAUD|nr:integrase [Gordonia phage Neville]YP_010245993.1 integrase [Gordonia phage Trax]AXQ64381.1 tyrosine integrase [Gordonia phage Neville]QDM55895.1 tyrosine integrase [Gordonia phage Trax]
MAWTVKKPSGKWQGLYRDASGKVKSAGMHPRKLDAMKAASHKEAVSRKDEQALSEVTLQEWYDDWFETRRVTRKTKLEDEARFNNRVLPKFGSTPLAEIDHTAIDEWINELAAENLSPSTITKHVHNLSAAMKAAVYAKLIPSNPCIGVKKPKPDPTPDRYLTHDEANAVSALLTGMNLFIWQVLISTGARWGEAVALHWDHVDFKNKRIELVLAWDRKSKVFTPLKNRSRRFVPMSDELETALRERLAEYGYGEATSFPYEPKSLTPRHGVILSGPSGMPWAPTNFSHAIIAAGNAAKVSEEGIERIVGPMRPHDLRHTYASWLLQDGVKLEVVSRLLGHSSVTITERYARLGDESWDSVRQSLNA